MQLSQKLKDECQKKGWNWSAIEQFLVTAAKDAPALVDAVISLIGIFSSGTPVPASSTQALAASCPCPAPSDGKGCCCAALHHILLAAVCCECNCCSDQCDCDKCRAETVCHLAQALVCLGGSCC